MHTSHNNGRPMYSPVHTCVCMCVFDRGISRIVMSLFLRKLGHRHMKCRRRLTPSSNLLLSALSFLPFPLQARTGTLMHVSQGPATWDNKQTNMPHHKPPHTTHHHKPPQTTAKTTTNTRNSKRHILERNVYRSDSLSISSSSSHTIKNI